MTICFDDESSRGDEEVNDEVHNVTDDVPNTDNDIEIENADKEDNEFQNAGNDEYLDEINSENNCGEKAEIDFDINARAAEDELGSVRIYCLCGKQ